MKNLIFVTVGTHEEQFNRLIKFVDKLKERGIIQEEVTIQTGFSTYKPKFCKWSRLFSYQDMIKNVKDARIVITHGGPSSFIMPLQIGKIPIVVPRQKQFNEHVNDHQVDFTKSVAERKGNIIVVENIADLQEKILNYKDIINSMSTSLVSNNKRFNEEFERLLQGLIKEGV